MSTAAPSSAPMGSPGEALRDTLAEAERAGLRLAIKGRLVALALLALWFVGSRSADPGLRGPFACCRVAPGD